MTAGPLDSLTDVCENENHALALSAMARHNLTLPELAALIGVDDRTLRNYRQPPGAPSHRDMPEPTRRLLILLLDQPSVIYALRAMASR